MTRRWDPINDRQADVLERIADGNTLSAPADAPLRTTAYALRSRGLVNTTKRGGTFVATITPAGRYYIEHGHHPEQPTTPTTTPTASPTKTPASSGPTAKADAEALIERLRSAPDKTVTIRDPSGDDRAAYRRTIHAAKQHRLVPDGTLLRHTGRSGGDIVIRLLDAAHPDETDWNRIRLNLRKPKPAEKDLREQLTENPAALHVSDTQRERAINFLIALNAAGLKDDQGVKLLRRGKYAKLGYFVGTSTWYLKLSEDDDTVPTQQPAGRNPRYWPSYGTKRVPSGRLHLQIDHRDYTDHTSKLKPLTWVEDKHATLEKRTRQIVNDIAERAVLVARQREEERRRWDEQHAEWERQQRETKQQWQAAMTAALPQAVDALRHATLIAALSAWRDARDLREICAVLDSQARDAQRSGQHSIAANLTRWRETGLTLAARLDPTIAPASLANIDYDALKPTHDDLRPCLDGWSPDYPQQDYLHKTKSEPKRTKPWPKDWETKPNHS